MTLAQHKEGIAGVNFLRNAVELLNDRPEKFNENKTPGQLLNDVLRHFDDDNYLFIADRTYVGD